jgi:hypothetical protein
MGHAFKRTGGIKQLGVASRHPPAAAQLFCYCSLYSEPLHSLRVALKLCHVTHAHCPAHSPPNRLLSASSVTSLSPQRVVFLGWPGQNEPEDHAEGTQPCDDGAALRIGLPPPPSAAFSEASVLSDMRDTGQAAQPPRILAEQLAQAQAPGQRQLGYAVVTRPVRQGRLRLALEEVLSMQLEPESTAAAGKQPASTAGEADNSSGELSTGATAGSPAAAAAVLPGAAGDAMSPAVLLGLDKRGEDPASGDDASSLGSRASSSSNLRCAGATLVRATTSTQHLEAVAASNAPLRLLLAEDNAINMKVGCCSCCCCCCCCCQHLVVVLFVLAGFAGAAAGAVVIAWLPHKSLLCLHLPTCLPPASHLCSQSVCPQNNVRFRHLPHLHLLTFSSSCLPACLPPRRWPWAY